MNEHMSGEQEVTDRGPRFMWPRIPAETPENVAVIRQGRDRPRLLSIEDRRLAQHNRTSAREEAAQFEQWAVGACGARPYSGFIPLHNEYVPD